MKKTFYYNFFPTKPEEETAAARGIPHIVTRTLVEIRDLSSPPQIDPNNPWQIRKSLTTSEVINGMLTLMHEETFTHIFRYWTLDMCDHVVTKGNKSYVIIFDYTDEGEPKRFQSPSIFIERAPNNTYVLGWMDVVQSRLVNPGDEIGLFWDARSGTLGFKLLRRNNLKP